VKKTLYILFFLCSFANGFSQVDSAEVFAPIETMPQYPGGMKELMSFIQSNRVHPKGITSKDITCNKVKVKFVILSDGSVSQKDIAIILSSGSPLVDDEAKRLVSIMPNWKPGTQNGKPVPVYFNLPISFPDYNIKCSI
jgi:protein TonB